MNQSAILYCHCQYARVIPDEVKNAVLRKLCESGQPFEAVADLCEMSARRDPTLARLAACGPVKVAACFPRAVKWLFAAANAPLSNESTEVVNLRTLSADDACAALFNPTLNPNLPTRESQITRGANPSSEAIPA
jgi:hypothetical protein